MVLKNKSVLIIGMGKSGISSAKLCSRLGADVTIYDSKASNHFTEMIDAHTDYGFKYVFGEFEDRLLDINQYMILSPGVPTSLSFIEKAKRADQKIKVIGEIELAYCFGSGNIIGITGTNGKTTTTTLVGEIVKLTQDNTYVVGNIGIPYTDIADLTRDDDMIVIELSSYQLEAVETFRPKVSCILNLTEDHLQRHITMENYGLTKLNITKNQDESDWCILNNMDEFCRSYASKIKAKVIWFSTKEKVQGVYVKGGLILSNIKGKDQEVMKTSDIPVLGEHNVENVLAAIAMCQVVDIPMSVIIAGIKAFKGVAHRNEFVVEIDGVRYYNDSKATNPDAAIKAIEAMDRPTILLAGGMDKDSDYTAWIKTFQEVIKTIVLYGETAEMIATACRINDFDRILIADGFEDAVIKASKLARPGYNVLLSPACASWDMFPNFEVRGDLFKEIVFGIKQKL